MRYAHTVADVRRAEQELMAQLPAGTLMQRAASGLAAACADVLSGSVYGSRVLVVAGAGDNGGDALYAGAQLARRGCQVHAVLVSGSAHEGGLTALRSVGGRVVEDLDPSYDLVLDGIVGIGGRPGIGAELVRLIDSAGGVVVAVDVPSGVEVDSGCLDGPHVSADLTVTFGTPKVAHFVQPAAAVCGAVELVDIGLQPFLGDPALEVLQDDDVAALLPRPSESAHKYTRGVLGVAAGSEQYTGAGVLVVSAALATGLTGMVRYQGGSEALVRSAHPEVVVGAGRVQAWAVGSGLAGDAESRMAEVIGAGLPTVVDADALGQLPDQISSPMVLTPHAGELADLVGVDRVEIEARMLHFAVEVAEQRNAVVLLKGSHSVVAAPDGRVRVNVSGVPWLATAGAGDVLTGVIGALLAAGVDPFDAASAGAWLHGAAAAIASDGAPLTASDVVTALPEALRRVLAR